MHEIELQDLWVNQFNSARRNRRTGAGLGAGEDGKCRDTLGQDAPPGCRYSRRVELRKAPMSQAITSRFKSDEFAAFVELDQDSDYRSLDHYRGEGYGRLLMDVKTSRILGAEYRDPETDEVVDGQSVDCRVVPPLSEQLRRADGDAVWLSGNFSCWTFCVYNPLYS